MLGFTIQTAAAQNPKFTAIITVFAIITLPHYQHPEAILHFAQAQN
jgi:hypothetical protein